VAVGLDEPGEQDPVGVAVVDDELDPLVDEGVGHRPAGADGADGVALHDHGFGPRGHGVEGQRGAGGVDGDRAVGCRRPTTPGDDPVEPVRTERETAVVVMGVRFVHEVSVAPH
jgi:hypothetical protein